MKIMIFNNSVLIIHWTNNTWMTYCIFWRVQPAQEPSYLKNVENEFKTKTFACVFSV